MILTSSPRHATLAAPPAALPMVTTDNRRVELEQFVRDRFRTAWGAEVGELLPWLVGVRDHAGHLTAVAGLRPAATGTLFLEHYLDRPVEEVITAHTGEPVAREQIIEVGNLAAGHPGGGRDLIIALTAYLHQAQTAWVCFTGGPILHNAFCRLGLAPICLAPARPEALGAAATRWGRYYDQHPHVFAGRVEEGFLGLSGWLTAEQLVHAARHIAPARHARSLSDFGDRDEIRFSAADRAQVRQAPR